MISIVHPSHKGHSGRHLHSRVHEGHPFNEGIMGRVTTLQRKSHRRSPFLEGIMRRVTPFKEGLAEGQYPSGRVWEGTFPSDFLPEGGSDFPDVKTLPEEGLLPEDSKRSSIDHPNTRE
jgi:hypothetical protein